MLEVTSSRQRQSWASPGTMCAAGSAGGSVCPGPAVEAVSWGLGTGGQVGLPRVLVGLIVGRGILREFSPRALGPWVQLWVPKTRQERFQWLVPQ